MEPVTHFLTGAILSRAGCNRKTALATVTMVLAAEAADLDVVAYAGGSATGFIAHRGITHTFLAVPFLAAFVVAVVWLLDLLWQSYRRSRGKPAPAVRRWGWLYLFACLAALSHLLLDFTNNYGLRPFYPFVRTWYAWDIVFIVEPLILAAFILALTLPWLFALINSEIGARQKGPRGRGAAITALIFVVALWGLRDFEHRRALAALDAYEFHGQPSHRIAAFPTMVNPFRWAGVAENDTGYFTAHVDSLTPEVDPGEHPVSYFKPEVNDVTRAASQSRLGRAYLEWARFPILEAEHLPQPVGGDLVRLRDMRFLYLNDTGRDVLAAYIQLDSAHRPVYEGFRPPASH